MKLWLKVLNFGCYRVKQDVLIFTCQFFSGYTVLLTILKLGRIHRHGCKAVIVQPRSTNPSLWNCHPCTGGYWNKMSLNRQNLLWYFWKIKCSCEFAASRTVTIDLCLILFHIQFRIRFRKFCWNIIISPILLVHDLLKAHYMLIFKNLYKN